MGKFDDFRLDFIALTRHAEIFSLRCVVPALRARYGLVSIVFETLSTYVIFAVTNFAPQARVLAQFITGLA